MLALRCRDVPYFIEGINCRYSTVASLPQIDLRTCAHTIEQHQAKPCSTWLAALLTRMIEQHQAKALQRMTGVALQALENMRTV
eukprot:210276-Pelagomonas_calceolata.AAC.1